MWLAIGFMLNGIDVPVAVSLAEIWPVADGLAKESYTGSFRSLEARAIVVFAIRTATPIFGR